MASSRWCTHALVLVVLFMTYCAGDSQAERFETARAFAAVGRPGRRRPGRSVQGFRQALAKLPTAVFRALRATARRQIADHFRRRWTDGGFVVLGCDGSRLTCPRTPELERALGRASKDAAAPVVWLTAIVHLRLGVPWDWRLGRGTASERGHLEQMLADLPPNTLLVADAGYVGYELAQALLARGVHFLIRVSSAVKLYAADGTPVDPFRDGPVYCWPTTAERRHKPPLPLRLIRVRAAGAAHDVWLMTSVRDPARLSAATAGQYYRWRWGNEGLFRTYKQTLQKTKLRSRTLRLVHREAEGSLLALQLLLAHGAWAMPRPAAGAAAPVCSPRRLLLEVRREMAGRVRGCQKYLDRIRAACVERRPRASPKAVRPWPRRKPHTPPKPPKLHTLTDAQKAVISRLLAENRP